MSKHELLQAYLGGRIAQRAFVRALVALGVSLSAASAYAAQLTPTKSDNAALQYQTAANAPASSDFYNDLF